MKLTYYICRFGRWHIKGIVCVCGRKPAYWADRKCADIRT